MKSIHRRVGKLEERFEVSKEKQVVFVTRYSGKKLALDKERCIQSFDECGFILASGFTLVHLGRIPSVHLSTGTIGKQIWAQLLGTRRLRARDEAK